MPFILIKNNLKLMYRSKWIIFVMILLTIITIALLSSVFHDLLNSDHSIDEFKVGYRMNSDSTYQDILPQLKSICRDNKAILQEYPSEDIDTLMKSKIVSVFVDIKDDNSYKIYRSDDRKMEASVVESIFSGFFYRVNAAAAANAYQAQHGLNEMPKLQEIPIDSEVLKTDPVASSTDYYGIIYVVYFAWCGVSSLLAIVSSERKGAVSRRMRVAHMPRFNYYIAKALPCTLAIFIETCAAWGLSVLLFDIHWGNIFMSAFIIFLISLAAGSFGVVIFKLFNNISISIALTFVMTWIWGFFGGTFQTYMYSNLPKILIDLSPFYYIDRTLVEYSTKGYSDYTGRCIAVLIGLTVFFGIAGMLLANRKMEEQ